MTTKLYPKQDHPGLGDWYVKHVQAMTEEGLHSKPDIAAQLAWRDRLIAELAAVLAEASYALDWWMGTSEEEPDDSDRRLKTRIVEVHIKAVS